VVQRSWSNLAIIDGHDPCVPALDGEVNFNAAPEMADTVTFRGIVPVTGVLIPQGQSKTIPVDLFSDGPIAAPWTVQAFDTSALFGGTPVLDFAFDKTTGLNGDKLMLTITVSGTVKSTHNFLLVSSIGKTQHFWFGVVGVM
jgi:hypothetical protein